MSTAERHLLLKRFVSEVRRKGVRQIIEKGFKGGRRIIRMELRRRGDWSQYRALSSIHFVSRRPQLLILIPAVPCGTELSGSTGNSTGNVKTVTESVLSDLDV